MVDIESADSVSELEADAAELELETLCNGPRPGRGRYAGVGDGVPVRNEMPEWTSDAARAVE